MTDQYAAVRPILDVASTWGTRIENERNAIQLSNDEEAALRFEGWDKAMMHCMMELGALTAEVKTITDAQHEAFTKTETTNELLSTAMVKMLDGFLDVLNDIPEYEIHSNTRHMLVTMVNTWKGAVDGTT